MYTSPAMGNRPANAVMPPTNAAAPQNQYQYVPFYYPAPDEALSGRRAAPYPPASFNGASSPPTAPQNRQQDEEETPPAWGSFSEFSNNAGPTPGNQISQE